MTTSIHQSIDEYWAAKDKERRRYLKYIGIILLVVGIAVLLATYAKGEEPKKKQIMKVIVMQDAGPGPEWNRFAVPVPNAQVSLFHGEVDPTTATNALWSVPVDAGGEIIAGVRDGIYTLAVGVNGKYVPNIRTGEKYPKITIKGGNGFYRYVIAGE